MHDPSTLAFDISIPLPWKRAVWLKSGEKDWAKYSLLSIWHVDPERDGTDDSCGWFPRARHGDQSVLEKIVKRFGEDWDRTWTTKAEDHDPDDGPFHPRIYYYGLFYSNGAPHMSVQSIVLNLFFAAAIEHFQCDGRSNWKKARKWMRRNLFDIMLFAENPVDSLFDTITRKFGGDTIDTPRQREQRIRDMAAIIYGWILRQERPWWKHPKWHVWHWRLQVHFLQRLKRLFIDKCSKCGKGFSRKDSAIGDWGGTRIWHERCDDSHKQCSP